MGESAAGSRVTIMGLGRFGGSLGVIRHLAKLGCTMLVTDQDPPEKLADSISAIQQLVNSGQVTLRLGEHRESDFSDADLVVASAAVPTPWKNRYLQAARAAGAQVTTEIALSIQALRERGVHRTVGITGSAGKSTTTAMIFHALKATLGDRPGFKGIHVAMGGNIGGSLLDALDAFSPSSVLVLELSSAQLYWLNETLKPAWSPKVALVTNISPNHIDWHGEFDHYQESKKHLLRHQHPGDVCVLGAGVADWAALSKGRAIVIHAASITGEIALPGEHNRTNAAGALLACKAIAPKADPQALLQAISAFTGLEHRLQRVSSVRLRGAGSAVRFYNDSKSTTPESCLKAIDAIATMPECDRSKIHLIAGGYDKGSDLSAISHAAKDVAGLYTIGVTGPKLASAAGGEHHRAFDCGTLVQAFAKAIERVRAGDVVLLSPGCASWDQYVNFESRGDEFVALVKNLPNSGHAVEAPKELSR